MINSIYYTGRKYGEKQLGYTGWIFWARDYTHNMEYGPFFTVIFVLAAVIIYFARTSYPFMCCYLPL